MIRIRALPTSFQVTLIDYSLSYQLDAAAETLGGCFAALDKALGEDSIPWKQVKYGKGEEARREADRKALDNWERNRED